MHLLDSDYIIYFLHGREEFVSVIEGFSKNIAISAISIGEIMEGLGGKRHEKKLQIFTSFLKTVQVLPVDKKVAVKFATIRRKLSKNGEMIGDLDTLIAATCLANDLILAGQQLFRVEP